jgi:hypothetical protein
MHGYLPTGVRRRARHLIGALLLAAAPALPAYVLFAAGGFMGYTWNKWGDDHAPGTGATVYWSYMPAGTPGSAYCSDACTGTSTTTFPNFYDHSLPGWRTVDLHDFEPYIESALATWSKAANITFIGPIADSGLPINDPGAAPPATGHIRIGAFAFVGGAQFLGGVGYAPPPNGGTGEGDVILNAANFFQVQPGVEDVTPIEFQFGNDIEGLLLHEIGHAIGLAHSDVDGSVMYIEPAGEYLLNHELHADDIAGVQVLYGPAIDTDGDGLADVADNCRLVGNNGQPNTGAAQNDTDADGIGNMCDADFNQTCTVDFTDLGELKGVFFQAGALEENMNGSGAVDFLDLGLFKSDFFDNYTVTNPSGVPNVCAP